jgi:hypothetical protein
VNGARRIVSIVVLSTMAWIGNVVRDCVVHGGHESHPAAHEAGSRDDHRAVAGSENAPRPSGATSCDCASACCFAAPIAVSPGPQTRLDPGAPVGAAIETPSEVRLAVTTPFLHPWPTAPPQA